MSVPRPKRVATLRKELAQLREHEADLLNAAKHVRERMDEVEAVLELLGEPEPGARLGLLLGVSETG